MMLIPLTKGKFASVSIEDYMELRKYNWSVNSCNYASRGKKINGKKKFITMHRFIMNPPDGMQVDHINGNRLDNRRCNLRICTRSQNCSSRDSSTKNKSGFRGVIFHSSTKKWRACIKVNQKMISLGLFHTKLEAARAYNDAAIQNFGQFARVNDLGMTPV